MAQEVYYDEYHWMQLQWLDDIYVISRWLCADFYMQSMQPVQKMNFSVRTMPDVRMYNSQLHPPAG